MAARILIVEDEALSAMSLAESLTRMGYQVVDTVDTGEGAVEAVERHPVDLILMDIMLKGSMTGIEAAKRINAKADVPVIYLSAYSDDETLEGAKATKPYGYIVKPYPDREIRAAVEMALHQHDLEVRRRHAEAEREEYARKLEATNRTLEAFSYSVAHDLRAPLRAAHHIARQVLDQASPRLTPEERSDFARVLASLQKMSDIVKGLLALGFASQTSLQTSEVEVSLLTSSVFAELREGEDPREVDLKVEPGIRVEGDARLWRSVLQNVLENALRFTAERNPATIEVAELNLDGERVVRIRDNGIGLDLATAKGLFEPFRQFHHTHAKGGGLGLATVKRAMERMGGRVWMESAPGQGAALFLALGRHS